MGSLRSWGMKHCPGEGFKMPVTFDTQRGAGRGAWDLLGMKQVTFAGLFLGSRECCNVDLLLLRGPAPPPPPRRTTRQLTLSQINSAL